MRSRRPSAWRPTASATTFTMLGENVTDLGQATAAAAAYLRLLDRIEDLGLDTEVSVKLTQLGLDLDPEHTRMQVVRLAERSGAMGRTVWIDMESAGYVEGTVDLYEGLLKDGHDVGLCMQAYLKRTWDDVQRLLPHGPSIRLVKGAYRESPDAVFTDRRVIDEAYLRLATHLATDPEGRVRRTVLGTHDIDLDRADRGDGGRGSQGPRRDRDALRDPRRGSTAARARRVRGPHADLLRRPLVPVVHAPDRGEAGPQHPARAAEPPVSVRLRGAIAASVTPLKDGGRTLDTMAFEPLTSFLSSGGVDGVLACGTTGEGVLLNVGERRTVTELFLDTRPRGFMVAVHAGAQTTAETVALAAHAQEVGADAVAVIAPPYYPRTTRSSHGTWGRPPTRPTRSPSTSMSSRGAAATRSRPPLSCA